jgi:excisionase family DNA binding protein
MQPSAVAEPLVTSDQVARALGVHRVTVYRWAEAGKIPGVKVGRVWRFDATEVAEAVAAGEVGR